MFALRSIVVSSVLSIAAALTSAVGGAGCSAATDAGESSSAQALTGANELCSAACARITGCGGSADVTSCTTSCQSGSGTTISSLGAAANTGASGCVDHASCSDVLGANFVNDCIDVALEETGSSSGAAPGATVTTGTYGATSGDPQPPTTSSRLRVD